MKSDICYIVSHGFAARMLLQTNLIGRLTECGLKVSIISHNAKDPNFESFAANPLVSLFEWKSKSSIWDDDYLYKRMYFLEDIKANTALKEKFYNALFYSKSIHPWKRLRPIYYYLIYTLVKRIPSIRKNFLKKEGKYLVSEEAKNLLKIIQPRLLVSTYPVSIMEAKLLYEAKHAGIETVLHLLSWDNITCKGKFPVLPDRFIVWGEIMEEELKSFYSIDSDRIVKCGVTHFDEHVEIRESGCSLKDIQQTGQSIKRPYLFFAMSSPRFAPREIDIVEWLANAIDSGQFGSEMSLVVRPHPQNVQDFTAKKSWLGRLDKIESDQVKIDYPEMLQSKIRWSMKKSDMTRLSTLISDCSICFNSGSTISIDALMHNKPVILTSFDGDKKLAYWNSAKRLKDYTHLAKLIKEGGVRSVGDYSELKHAVNIYLKTPEHDLEKRRSALLRECFKDDGLSTQRVVEALRQMIRQAKS
ncbi:hypothetical protein [Roseivirga sp.]|uniref:hypothetical protein n=1 Tax=Roseivirga sp. TaxID=1964215 RepID=UPI003B8D0D95